MRVNFQKYDCFLNNVINKLYDYFQNHPEYKNPVFTDDCNYDVSKIRFDNHKTIEIGNDACGSPDEMFDELIEQLEELT